MKYLTKEWYNLCQQTDLHLGMRVHQGAVQKDEALYLRLKKRKEIAYLKSERQIYHTDPRFMLDVDGSVFVSAQKFISGEEIHEEDTIVYQMSDDEKEKIHAMIAAYDSRPPFDTKSCKIDFERCQEIMLSNNAERVPPSLYTQIADPRVFTLGYCTKEMLVQLKKQSHANKVIVDDILNQYRTAMENVAIPERLSGIHGFHDCQITQCEANQNLSFYLTSGGFTDYNRIVFHDATITKQEQTPEGSHWLNVELYPQPSGYEVHILLFHQSAHEFTVCCKDITFLHVAP
jgi:hypothetical protein